MLRKMWDLYKEAIILSHPEIKSNSSSKISK